MARWRVRFIVANTTRVLYELAVTAHNAEDALRQAGLSVGLSEDVELDITVRRLVAEEPRDHP